jgi:hypothetical protein
MASLTQYLQDYSSSEDGSDTSDREGTPRCPRLQLLSSSTVQALLSRASMNPHASMGMQLQLDDPTNMPCTYTGRSGVPMPDRVPEARRVRQRSSRRMECSFQAVLWLRRITDTWELAIQYPNHNHPASSNLSVHPLHRRQDLTACADEIKHQFSIGNSVRQILAAHRAREAGIAPSQHDIWNSRAELRRVLLDGRTPAQALIS